MIDLPILILKHHRHELQNQLKKDFFTVIYKGNFFILKIECHIRGHLDIFSTISEI